MKRVNIIVGRFQPLTKGHMKCIEEAYKKKHLPTVIVMIDTPDEKVDERHPFPTTLLMPIYKEIFVNDKRVIDIVTAKNANIVAVGNELYKLGYQVASWTCGEDRLKNYSYQAEHYAAAAKLAADFEIICINRTNEDISATKVREALLNNDKKEFLRLTPELPLRAHIKINVFDVFREQILKVYK